MVRSCFLLLHILHGDWFFEPVLLPSPRFWYSRICLQCDWRIMGDAEWGDDGSCKPHSMQQGRRKNANLIKAGRRVWFIQTISIRIQGLPCSRSARKMKITSIWSNILKKAGFRHKLDKIWKKKYFLCFSVSFDYTLTFGEHCIQILYPRHAGSLSLA